MISALPQIPSYAQGIARHRGQSAYSGWWNELVGFWVPSLGPTGATLFDLSGKHSHGSLTNMDPATDWVASPHGWALDFDGSNDYVGLGTGALGEVIDGSLGATVIVWARYASLTAAQYGNRIVVGWMISNNGLYLSFRGDGGNAGKLMVGGRSTSTDSFQSATSAVALAADSWHQLVGIYDYPGDTITLGIDGRLESPASVSFGSNVYTHSAHATYPDSLGGGVGAESDLAGRIAMVQVYRRVLTSAEISRLYADPFAPLRPPGVFVGIAPAIGRFYRIAAGQTFQPGAAPLGQAFHPGPTAGQIDGGRG